MATSKVKGTSKKIKELKGIKPEKVTDEQLKKVQTTPFEGAALHIAAETITVNTAISRRVIVRLDQTLEGKSHVSSFGRQT